MMRLVLFPLLSFGARAAWASAVPKTAPQGHGWQPRWPAPPDGEIKLHIALKQEDGGAAIERQLLLASDPDSPAFRQHVGPEAAVALSRPTPGSVHLTEMWLEQHNLLGNASLFGGFFEIDTMIQYAEDLLNTTYLLWSDGTRDVVRTEMYHIPDTLADYIDFVTPTTMFPKAAVGKSDHWVEQTAVAEHTSLNRARDTCGDMDYSTPTCIREAYNIQFDGLNYTVQPDRTTFAIYATEGATYDPKDLQRYLEKYNPPAAEARASFEVNGNGDPASEGGIEPRFEVALDTQTLMGLAWPSRGILYNRGGVFGPNKGVTYDNFVVLLQELISNRSETLPSVVSISESFPENQMDADYAKRLCNMMAQVGTRGISLLFSSGNNGPNGDAPGGEHKAVFEPKFPSSCPWVTAVGGTTQLDDEKAATLKTIPALARASFTASGGGFSNLFPRPAYQWNVVTNYIAQHVPGSYYGLSGFTDAGRGIPDVAAFSTQFPTTVGPIEFPIAGTSAAAPTWAAVITLLNDYEAFHGRPSLGFLNPWLYNLTSGLKDITKGGNSKGRCWWLEGCNLLLTYGYDTTEGWDPVTGLGSPKFRELVEALEERSAYIRGPESDVVCR